MATYVLIHGAWHGAWCWAKVLPLLQKAGHTAVAPDLPGHGLDRTPVAEVTLARYVAKVCEVLDAQPEPVILVGHSMGGRVITQTAEARPGKIRTLVYLTAHVPLDGETRPPLVNGVNVQAGLQANRVMSDDGLSVVSRDESIKDTFYHDCSDADVAWAKALLVPQATKVMTEPVHTTEANFGRIPKVYIECTQDRTIPIELQRVYPARTPMARVFSLPTSHSPFLSAPVELANVLLELS
jgi:pimeloyl-ACP methyl ester carboxylesterase